MVGGNQFMEAWTITNTEGECLEPLSPRHGERDRPLRRRSGRVTAMHAKARRMVGLASQGRIQASGGARPFTMKFKTVTFEFHGAWAMTQAMLSCTLLESSVRRALARFRGVVLSIDSTPPRIKILPKKLR